MVHLITELSKYTMLILFALYTYQGFSSLKKGCPVKKQNRMLRYQIVNMFLIHLNAYAVLYFSTKKAELIGFYLMQVIFFAVILILYRTAYKNSSQLLVNNMCMLMAIGFVMLTRLSYDTAIRQFMIGIGAAAVSMLIPLIISRVRMFRRLTWLYAIAGIGMLGIVAVLGAATKGANLSITIAGIAIQPSEFIKIIFVFLIASMLYVSTDFGQVVKVTILAAVHVLILVMSRDLGGALIFFVAYLIMLFVATKNTFYFFGGLGAGCVASVVAYHLFNHVRVRVVAWKDPLSCFELEGNQISHSLFAIGTGGWFGMGLNQGMPYRIPEVKKDFIFSAIAEEFGGIFAICLILVCVSCFLMFLNIAMQMKDRFYKYVALGLGTIYGFQVFLSIGGNIKFIPSTGVTLPLVSYGGSSLLSTMIIFSIIQGLYLMRQKEGEEHEEKQREAKPRRENQNSEFAVIAYLFLGMFLLMMGYFVYFQLFRSEDFINSPYNKRQDTFSEHVIRGEIISADDKTLAQTIVNADGSESRYYPYGAMFAHAVGYDVNGKSGIESFANFNLLRSHAFFAEQIFNNLKDEKNPGDKVITTLDYELQKAAYDALGRKNGAVIVTEPSTGKILAMVSKPDFNPNTIAKDWNKIVNDAGNSVLLNRATQGLYPPGSTFKIFTTLEYIRENPNYKDYSYECTGSILEDKLEIHCAGKKVHGKEDLISSFADSCNTSYANIGRELDNDGLAKLCNSLLFNAELPVSYPFMKSSFVLNGSSNDMDAMQTAIGQGKTLVTPMHMALITSAIANDGVLMNPYVIDRTENYKGITVKKYKPSSYGVILNSSESKILQEFMRRVVTDGTGSRLDGQKYTAAGKTGSAEYSNDKGKTHAWFTGYAYDGKHGQIAVTVIVEGGGSGSKVAVPAAKAVFDAYFNR